MLLTKRHKKDLFYRGHILIAPRFFEISNGKNDCYLYYVHISKMCDYVEVWYSVDFSCLFKLNYNNVMYIGKYKLYSNTKGIFFNFRNYYNKIVRIYICD